MKKVLFVSEVLPQYRREFFDLIKKELLKSDIEFELVYGKHEKTQASKKDEIEIAWARYIPNRIFYIRKTHLVWQPVLNNIKNQDLVIVENANRLMVNYYLMATRKLHKYKLAFWGHGRNRQADINSWKNKFKYLFLNKCDWWFTYTELTKKFLLSRNYPSDRITVFQNAIDTSELQRNYAKITEEEIIGLKKELGIDSGVTAIYCGGMYREKNFDFILETCYRIKREIPDFHMIFLGAGSESAKIMNASDKNDWIHYIGPKFGKDRIQYFKISSIQLMPYYLGLGVVDSFALETPMITTSNPYHGPEIDYLQNGVNGIVTNDNIDDYSQKVIMILKNKGYLELIEGCRASAEKITLEQMVTNFKEGILKCLNIPDKSYAPLSPEWKVDMGRV